MSLAATNPPATAGSAAHSETRKLWRVFLLALVAVMVFSAGNLLDPMVRYDDFPALLAEPEGFWFKTLAEGRWLNYVWHLRGVVTPAWLNFAVYQALWALLAASLAVAVLPGRGRMWFAGLLALTILVAPPALFIAMWFNTLLPGLAVIAIYAALSAGVSQRTLRLLLPVFTVAAFMAYTTYPLVLLAVCLARTEKRSLRDLAGLIALFVGSIVLAMLATYALNWVYHGVFGVELDISRKPTPAHDLAGLIANVEHLGTTFGGFLERSAFKFTPLVYFHLALFALSTVVLARRAPMEALYYHAGLWLGMGLVVAQVLKLGIFVPSRAFQFAWIYYAIIIVRSTEILSLKPGMAGRMARNAVLLITCSYLLQATIQYTIFRNWQAETRAVAADLRGLPGPVYVVGDVMNHPSADEAGIQQHIAIDGRLRQLTGQGAIVCADTPAACAGLPDFPASDNPKMRVERIDGMSVVVIPPQG
ncbi:hypothetical protein [Salipiger sp.]|uniref:hypothetical protein n=1 Tax=Salipiger sp. TaxID=2078585 RepID=UPI003A972CF1